MTADHHGDLAPLLFFSREGHIADSEQKSVDINLCTLSAQLCTFIKISASYAAIPTKLYPVCLLVRKTVSDQGRRNKFWILSGKPDEVIHP